MQAVQVKFVEFDVQVAQFYIIVLHNTQLVFVESDYTYPRLHV